ncbi:hypothetical protein [Shewanella sp. M-Br]|uniref:hypothetical protein n=1 Tax=Shewanella sp. M-Br TaxID=2495595 RepID=UPI002949F1CC|nr:hypothetical protein SMBr_32750 [Shewanella sp. M-Br]
MSLLNKIEEINLAAIGTAEQSQADIPLEFMGGESEQIVSLMFDARIAKEEIKNLYKVVSHQRYQITEQANKLSDMHKRQDDFINLMLIQSNQLKTLISINKTLIEEIHERDESSLDC